MIIMSEIKQNDDNTKVEGDEKSWAKDIEKHDYYYDDSHGYEIYVDDEVEESEADRIICPIRL
jgi:hypothetical protein